MRIFLEKPVMLPELDNVHCNVCGREVKKNSVGYFEDHVSLTKNWGFHSPYDCEAHSIDLCVDCYKDWTSHFEIPPQVEHQTVIPYA